MEKLIQNTMKKILFLLAILCVQTSFAQLIIGNNRFEKYLPMLENKRVAVVCNHTSVVFEVNNDTAKKVSKHLVDTLLSKNINIKTLFTPEHGLKGTQEAGKLINGVAYYKDSIKIISLYGKNKKPTNRQMNDIDIVVFDLQDVGCRFYTYISTLEYVMAACIENSKPIIVLDRPNPNNFVAGPVLKNDCKSFVGMQPIPICYGLTIGEYAKMINDEHLADSSRLCDLTVIHMLNYNRDSIYTIDVFPSPNLQSMQAIRNYPTLCLFEGTPISVGRGTNQPFEIAGFPEYPIKIKKFVPKSIKGVAENPPYVNDTCFGVTYKINSQDIELEEIIEMYNYFPQKDKFFNRMFDLLTGDKTIKEQIKQGKSADDIRQTWEEDLRKYDNIRQKYLIYK